VLNNPIVAKSLALAQKYEPLANLQKFVQKFKTLYPDATPGQLAAAAQAVNPTIMQQADWATKQAGMSITSLFGGYTAYAAAVNAQARLAEAPWRFANAQAKFAGLGGPSPFSQQQLQAGADMMRRGLPISSALKLAVLNAYPDIASEAAQGQATQASNVAGARAAAVAPVKVQQAADTAVATAVPKAQSASLTQVDKTLSAIEPAYNALESNFSYLLDTANQYGMGPATPVNALLNKLRSMGSPDYTRTNLAMQAVQKEFGKVLSASTGARGVPVAAMREAAATLSMNMTIGQLKAAQESLQTDGRNVLDSYRKQRDALTSQLQGKNQAAPAALSPQDQQALAWADANPNDPRAALIKQHLQGK
jgi:hypothetical protein